MTEDAPIFDGLIWRSILPTATGDSGFTIDAHNPLNSRELLIAEHVARGLSAGEISLLLKISPETVKKHKGSLYRKMGVENELEMALKAIDVGLLSTADLVSPDFDPTVFDKLTPRQREVTELIALGGYANKDIARKLNLSEHTVKDLVSLVFERTHISQRVDLAVGYLEARRREEVGHIGNDDRPVEAQIFP